MSEILLPSITGKFGNWRYYQIIMKIKDIVENFGNDGYRIKTVEEVDVIYSQEGVSNLLQRAFDIQRLEPIKQYLLKQSDRYINNLTVAIFGGSPDWLPISLEKIGLQSDKKVIKDISKSFGIIRLLGNEVLFVLDGQHRLKGLREAVKDANYNNEDELAITLIVHENTGSGKKRTRRLFSTINRHAKPVSEGENILLDEDDVSAIIVRRLIEEYHLFKGKKIIALNKTANLSASDKNHFSTVISLWNVIENIVNNDEIYSTKIKNKYLRVRPLKETTINSVKEYVFKYWDEFFSLFPKAKDLIVKEENYRRKDGGAFYLRPIGQEIISILYRELKKINELKYFKYLSEVEEELNTNFWHYVLWDPHKNKMINNKSFASKYLLYNFGFQLKQSEILTLEKNYKRNSGDLELKLNKPRYNFLNNKDK